MTEDKFCECMAEYFLRIGFAKTQAEANLFANWTFGRATDDCQGGWNMTFSKNWDTTKALDLVLRYIRMHICEEDEC